MIKNVRRLILLTTLIMSLFSVGAFAFTEIEIGNKRVTYDKGQIVKETVIHNDNKRNSLAASGEINSEKSWFDPDTLSYYCEAINYLYLSLNDEDYDNVTGIKANRLDLIQNGNVILRTYGLQSRSSEGYYSFNSWMYDDYQPCYLIRPFANSNGTNYVDVVLYNNDIEVARIKDKEINVYSDKIVNWVDVYVDLGTNLNKFKMEISIFNCNEDEDIKVYIKDKESNELLQHGEIIDNYQDEDEKELYLDAIFDLTDEIKNYVNEYDRLETYVEIDGESVEFENEWDKEIYFEEDTYINSWWWPCEEDGRIIFRVEGQNLFKSLPYTFKYYGEDKKTLIGTQENIIPLVDEKNYVSYMDLDITNIIETEDEPLYVEVFDKNGESVGDCSFNFDNSEYEYDNVPYNYNRLDTDFNVSNDKAWKVKFSEKVDSSTIGNIKVVNSKGNEISISKSMYDDYTVQIKPSKSYQTYDIYSIIVEGVKSLSDNKQVRKAIKDFTVK